MPWLTLPVHAYIWTVGEDNCLCAAHLACVNQAVAVVLSQQVRLCQDPQLEHVVADLAPQRKALQHVVVLPLVVVRQTCTVGAPRDAQAVPLLYAVRPEVLQETHKMDDS
jgi:hypothetical protein